MKIQGVTVIGRDPFSFPATILLPFFPKMLFSNRQAAS
jgi:hypothetical protein